MKKVGHYLCHLFEILRYFLVTLGIFIANNYELPQKRLAIITIFFIPALNGLTGIEGYFLGKYSSQISGYKDPGSYQKQSAINNLALALTSIIAYIFNWGSTAQVTLLTTMLLFFIMSAFNHAVDFFKYNNRTMRNFLRPIITIILTITVLYFVMPIIKELKLLPFY